MHRLSLDPPTQKVRGLGIGGCCQQCGLRDLALQLPLLEELQTALVALKNAQSEDTFGPYSFAPKYLGFDIILKMASSFKLTYSPSELNNSC